MANNASADRPPTNPEPPTAPKGGGQRQRRIDLAPRINASGYGLASGMASFSEFSPSAALLTSKFAQGLACGPSEADLMADSTTNPSMAPGIIECGSFDMENDNTNNGDGGGQMRTPAAATAIGSTMETIAETGGCSAGGPYFSTAMTTAGFFATATATAPTPECDYNAIADDGAVGDGSYAAGGTHFSKATTGYFAAAARMTRGNDDADDENDEPGRTAIGSTIETIADGGCSAGGPYFSTAMTTAGYFAAPTAECDYGGCSAGPLSTAANGYFAAAAPPHTTAECDYDVDPTELYLAVQNKRWDKVARRSPRHPEEAATWVYRREKGGAGSLRWRLLPLHAAVVFGAPPAAVAALLAAYEEGAQCVDDQGKLPIHLCFRRDTDAEVVAMLVRAYPGCTGVEDDKGRTPLVLASRSNSVVRDAWIGVLEGSEGPAGPVVPAGEQQRAGGAGGGAGGGDALPIPAAALEIAPSFQSSSSSQSSSTRPPRPPSRRASSAWGRARNDVADGDSAKSRPGAGGELTENGSGRRRERRVGNSGSGNGSCGSSLPSQDGSEVEYTDGMDGVATILLESTARVVNKGFSAAPQARASFGSTTALEYSSSHEEQSPSDASLLKKGSYGGAHRAYGAEVLEYSSSQEENSPSDASLLKKDDLMLRKFRLGSSSNERRRSFEPDNLRRRMEQRGGRDEVSLEGAKTTSILAMAPPSLRDQMRDRLESRKNSGRMAASAKGSRRDSRSCGSSSGGYSADSSSVCAGEHTWGKTDPKPVADRVSLEDFIRKRRADKERQTVALMVSNNDDEEISVASSVCDSATDDGTSTVVHGAAGGKGRLDDLNSKGGTDRTGTLGRDFNSKKNGAWESTREASRQHQEEVVISETYDAAEKVNVKMKMKDVKHSSIERSQVVSSRSKFIPKLENAESARIKEPRVEPKLLFEKPQLEPSSSHIAPETKVAKPAQLEQLQSLSKALTMASKAKLASIKNGDAGVHSGIFGNDSRGEQIGHAAKATSAEEHATDLCSKNEEASDHGCNRQMNEVERDIRGRDGQPRSAGIGDFSKNYDKCSSEYNETHNEVAVVAAAQSGHENVEECARAIQRQDHKISLEHHGERATFVPTTVRVSNVPSKHHKYGDHQDNAHTREAATVAMQRGHGNLFSMIDEEKEYQEKDQVGENAMAAPIMGAGRLSSKTDGIRDMRKSKQLNSSHHGDEIDLYASTSLVTAPTAEMTEVLSGSYEDCTLGEVYTSRAFQAKSEEDPSVKKIAAASNEEDTDQFDIDGLSTPKLLMRLEKLRNSPFFTGQGGPVKEADGAKGSENNDAIKSLENPHVMTKADRFFSNRRDGYTSGEDPPPPTAASRVDAPSSPKSTSSSSTAFTQSKFDRLMAKYERMALDEVETPFESKDPKEETDYGTDIRKQFFPSRIPFQQAYSTSVVQEADEDCCSIPSVPSIKREAPSNPEEYTYSVPRGNGRDDASTSKNEDNQLIGIGSRPGLPKRQHPEQFKTSFNPSPISGLKLQHSLSGDSMEDIFMNIARVASEDSDVSTLSKTTGYTTLESASVTTANSAEIESYVQSIVHDVVAREVDNVGLMKKELETALKNKVKLEQRMKKLNKKSDEQSALLKKARREKKIAKDKFSREMEIQLTRKASELKSLIDEALNQAEESKQRAVELAKRDMEKEVSLLRSRLATVHANGVPIDESLQSALELVESNQRALLRAAENDAKSAIDMKADMEQSFVEAVGEFEAWSDKQLKMMEARWLRSSQSD